MIMQVRASSWPSLFDCSHRWEGIHILDLVNSVGMNAVMGTNPLGTAARSAAITDLLEPLVMQIFDKHGNEITPGTAFRYRCGPGEKYVTGKLVRKGRGLFIRWDDGHDDVRVKDFWYAGTDQEASEIISA